MGLNEKPVAERLHIAFFGLRNAGKSSLVNAVTNQSVSLVSNVKGTTTDPVFKTESLSSFSLFWMFSSEILIFIIFFLLKYLLFNFLVI